MFSSKEEKERKRQRKEMKRKLNGRLKSLESYLRKRQDEFQNVFEAYKQSVSEKWEYLQVSDKNIEQWGGLDNLGKLGWELVGISTYAEGSGYQVIYTLYVFKRKLPDLPDELLSEFSDILETKSEIEELKLEISSLN